MSKFGSTIAGAVVGAVLLLGAGAAQAAAMAAPHFDLPALDGKRYTDRYLVGKPTLVVFWASWCPVCQVELPKLHTLFEKVKGRGLQVLAIGFADEEHKIRRYVQSHSAIFDFPVLYDPQDAVAKRFGVVGTPTIYLINRSGGIEYVTWLIEDPALGNKLEKLLNVPEITRSGRLNLHQIDDSGLSLKQRGWISCRCIEPAAPCRKTQRIV
jgi:peroxiredoxin